MLSIPLVTGARELLFWDTIIISNKNALFFFNLILIAGTGGYIASKFKKQPKIRVAIMLGSQILALLVGAATFQSLPFRF